MSVTEIKTYRITCDFMVKGQGFSGKQDMVPCGNGVTVTGTNESVLESLNKLGWTRFHTLHQVKIFYSQRCLSSQNTSAGESMSNKKKSKNKGKQKDSFAKNGGTGYGRSISSGDVPKKEAPKSSAGQDDSTAASVAAFAERLKAMSGVVNSPEITDQRQQVITRLMTAFKSLSDPPESLAKIFERVGLPVKIVENVPGDPKYNSMIIMVEDFKAAETKLQEQGTVLDRLYPKPVVPQQDSSVKDSPNISDLGADTNIQMTRTQVIGAKPFLSQTSLQKATGI